jgi:LSD1 subclass zinc finger protein
MEQDKKSEHCMVCGSPLEYLQHAESLRCAYCGASGQGHVKCPEGHFVCEGCHRKDAIQMIEQTVFSTELQSPHEIAELMMHHGSLPMLGCEHAFIAAGAMMAALRNSPYGKGKLSNEDIREAFERTSKQAVAGYCGLTGVCGIAPAIGACFSVFLGARCGTDSEQKITMEAVIRVSQAIADLTGPSCCKAYVRVALTEATAMLGERFGIMLQNTERTIICGHAEKHPHGCREEKCPYFQKPSRDIFAESAFVPGTVCTS